MWAWLDGAPEGTEGFGIIALAIGAGMVIFGVIGSISFSSGESDALIAGIVSADHLNVTLETADGKRTQHIPTNGVDKLVQEGEVGVAYVRNGYLVAFKKNT